LPDLTTLDTTEVEQYRQLLTSMVAAYNPTADLKRGPVQDLIITVDAAISSAWQEQIDLVRQSSSLSQIAANPEKTDATTVNNLLSNYGLTASKGAKATGTVVIVLSSLVPTVIPITTVFTLQGITYNPTTTTAGRTTAGQVISSSDVLITTLGANYAMPVPVTATAVGAVGNVLAGTSATLSLNPPYFVSAYAGANFTGGQDAQTPAELAGMALTGLSVKAWSTRPSIQAVIGTQIPTLEATSVIGFGDPEMLRDQHAVWPGSQGGRVDVYMRSAPSWQTVSLSKQATLVSLSGSNGTWQISIGRDDAPGFYEVQSILLPSQVPGSPGFAVTSDVRGVNLAPDATHIYFPDITSALEAVYSRYQTAAIQFVDTLTTGQGSLTPGAVSTFNYTVLLKAMPEIDVAQDYLGQLNNRPPMSDALVRGVVPCFTTVAFTLTVSKGTTVSVPAVQNAVADAVNAINFTGALPASLVTQAVHNLLGASVISITTITLAGRIRRTDGVMIPISDPVNLACPNDPAHLATGRTVAFLLQAADVTVTVVTSS
jgi:hypothetical protein